MFTSKLTVNFCFPILYYVSDGNWNWYLRIAMDANQWGCVYCGELILYFYFFIYPYGIINNFVRTLTWVVKEFYGGLDIKQ